MPVSAESARIAQELRPSIRPIDLASPRSIHIVGIGGAGMRAIARILLAMGHAVSGSDRSPSPYLDELVELGAVVSVGHDAAQTNGVDFVTRSTAVGDDNPEIATARNAGIDVFSRAEILAAIVARRPAVLIAGTHGKTTTSSILSVVLESAGLAPSFVIGSDVAYFGTGAHWGDTEHFVVEADESDGTFLSLAAAHGVVTSLDPDHLDFYGSATRLHSCFAAFVESVPGTTAVCIDDPDNRSLIGQAGVVTYGTTADADLRLVDIVVRRDTTTFDVYLHGEHLGEASVGLPGHHNALNAGAAIVIAFALGCDFESIAQGLSKFQGVARRFETRGERLGIRFVDDYAHLPAEVEAAIATARQGPWRRVIAAYQPHRYSRTEALGETFAESFRGVDHLVLTDIYSSGEAPRPGVSGRIVYDAVTDACPDLDVSWQPSLDDVADHLAAMLGPGDLCLTLGAGDLTTVPDLTLDRLAEVPASIQWLHDLVPELADSNVAFNESIGALTTYRVGGAALAVAEIGSRTDLDKLIRAAADNQTPLLPVGKGSNLLVADRGFRGVALVLTGDFASIEIDDQRVTLGAAVSLPVAARRLVRHSLAGFEWAVGVPGSIGGAIVMNAGGHGSDMAATVTSASVIDLQTGQERVLDSHQLQFGYRSSSIAASALVLDATMELAIGDQAQGEALLSEIVRWRREHQPGGQNAGSVFTNPPGDSAGRLIDAAGGKGLRSGSAAVSEKHANFMQADEDGSADDVYALMQSVVALVREHSGIVLEPETRLVGFEDRLV